MRQWSEFVVTKAPFVNLSARKTFVFAKSPVKNLRIAFIFDRWHCSSDGATPVKYEHNIQQVAGVLVILKYLENNRMEEIGLITLMVAYPR